MAGECCLKAAGCLQSVSYYPYDDDSNGSQAASDDQQAFPAGVDAGTAACVQSDLYWMRPNPRIRDDYLEAAESRAVPACVGRMRRADGIDLRRRTAALSRD